MSDRWRDSYDAWKTASPYDDWDDVESDEEPVDDTPDREPPQGLTQTTRAAALEAFFHEVALAIPESDPDWVEKRERVRRAGVTYALAATRETVDDTNRVWVSLR